MPPLRLTALLLFITTAFGLLVLTANYRATHRARHSDVYRGYNDDLAPACCGRTEWMIRNMQTAVAQANPEAATYQWSPTLVAAALAWHVERRSGLLYALLLAHFGILLFGIRLQQSEN